MTHRLYIDGTKKDNYIQSFKSLDDALLFCKEHAIYHKGVYVFTDNGCVFNGKGY